MERAIGTATASCRARVVGRWRATLPPYLLAVLGIYLLLTSSAVASPSSFTWSGTSKTSEDWSFPANWEGALAPTAEIGTLTFPRLTSTACTTERSTHPCYISFNDVSSLSAESLRIDDGNSYLIGGEEVALGAGGLSAAPASGASGPAGDFVEVPLHLTASQTWSIADRSGGSIGENGMFQGGDLTGSASALTVELSNGPAWILENSTEVGPVAIDGASGTGRIANGLVVFEDGELNSVDEQAVDLSHIFFTGSGAVGPLTTDDAAIDVGRGVQPVEGIEASSVTLDAESGLGFEASGPTAQEGYSQLISHGDVKLNGSSIEVFVRPPKEGEPCPVLTPGQTFTFVSTPGTLSGSFANAPEGGAELPITFSKLCGHPSQTMQITYNRSGGAAAVIGTVEAVAFKKRQEEEAATKKHEEEAASERRREEEVKREEATRKLTEEIAKRVGAEVAAAETAARMKHEEEAAASKKRQEEEAAKTGVLGIKEGSPDATLASTSLQASASGDVSVKISCPAGESSCTGTVTLRTLNAVSASADAAKVKPAILALATGSFTVPGGEAKTVTLRLPAKARALLARLHTMRIRASIVARNPSGATHASQTIATLRAPKAKHGKG